MTWKVELREAIPGNGDTGKGPISVIEHVDAEDWLAAREFVAKLHHVDPWSPAIYATPRESAR